MIRLEAQVRSCVVDLARTGRVGRKIQTRCRLIRAGGEHSGDRDLWQVRIPREQQPLQHLRASARSVPIVWHADQMGRRHGRSAGHLRTQRNCVPRRDVAACIRLLGHGPRRRSATAAPAPRPRRCGWTPRRRTRADYHARRPSCRDGPDHTARQLLRVTICL